MPRISNKADLIAAGTKTAAALQQDEDKLNALHKFRTYGYHHVLIAANTTIAAAEVINEKTDITRFLHPGMSAEKKYEPIASKSGNGSYIVVINGMTDAQYLIDSIEWEAIFDPDAKSSNAHASFVEGSMQIQEPKGVRFMKVMKTVCDNLKSDPNGLTFILKTIFVGYTDESEGQGQVATILDVKPFQFFIYDITGEFTNAGSSYEISFVGQVNGTSRLPAFSTVQQSNITGGTIKDALASLQDTLNAAAKAAHEDLIKKLDESNNQEKHNAQGTNPSPKGRPIEYSILAHEDFASLPLDNTHIRNKSVANRAELGTPKGIDIESAISDIMYCSTGIAKMMREDADQNKGYRTIFKIESALTSSLDKVAIIYSVKKCKVPVITKDNRNKAGTIVNPDISNREILEFDYLYTGRNIEVLEYDMKMAMGLVFFQSLGSNNNLPAGASQGSGNTATVSNGNASPLNDKNVVMRDLTPVPIPGNIEDPAARNKVEPSQTADFRTFMARQAMLESVEAKLRIVGIPWLLDVFNLTAEDASTHSLVAQKEDLPLVKVNVRMPTEDFGGADADYTEDFWYEGYFYIISCKNIFRDGRFEQELDLISMMYEEMVTPSSTKPAASKPATNKPATATTSAPKSTINKPELNTAEQKVKNGVAPVTLSPKEQLNCQSIKQQPRPYTMETARRTLLSPNFSLETLTRNPINLGQLDDRILGNLCALAKKLEEVQALLGKRITVTSGYRSPAYNASVRGSSKTSDHMQGVAADIQVGGMSTIAVFNILKASSIDFRQVIHERNSTTSWVHISFNIDPGLAAIPASRKFFSMVV